MLDHLADDLTIPALAARVAMSERNFQRVFTRELRKAPAHYVEEIRIDRSILGFTLGLGLLTGLVFGAVPALRSDSST